MKPASHSSRPARGASSPGEAAPGAPASVRVVVVGRAAVVEDGGHLRTQPADGRFIDGLARALGSVSLLTPIVRRSDRVAWRSLRGYRHVPDGAVEVVEVPEDFAGDGGIAGSMRRWVEQGRVVERSVARADVLFVFLPSFRGVVSVFMARRRGIPVVVYLGSRWHRLARSTWRWSGWRTALRPAYEGAAWLLERWSVRCAQGRMLRGTQLMRVYGGAPGISEASPPIVAFDWGASRVDRKRSRDGKGATILHLGSLRKVKNIPSIIQAMNELFGRHPHARLLLAGSGPEETNLRERSRPLNEGRPGAVEFLGYVADVRDKADLLARADVLVLASFSEGFPRVIHEAFASGVPVVAPDLPEIRSEVPEGAVKFVDPHDVDSIADGIDFALDPDNAAPMVRIGHAIADAAFARDPVDVAVAVIHSVRRDAHARPKER